MGKQVELSVQSIILMFPSKIITYSVLQDRQNIFVKIITIQPHAIFKNGEDEENKMRPREVDYIEAK